MTEQLSTIEWSQAIETGKVMAQTAKINREKMLSEFLDSTADVFSSADLYYYSIETGKDIAWIVRNANFQTEIPTLIENAFLDHDSELIDLLFTYRV